jgi:hypothetical protein
MGTLPCTDYDLQMADESLGCCSIGLGALCGGVREWLKRLLPGVSLHGKCDSPTTKS